MAKKLPAGITQDELDEYAKIDRVLKNKKLNDRHAALNKKIKAAFVKLGTFIHGDVIIKRGERDSFDAKAAEEEFPFEKFPEYYKPVFDATTLTAAQKKKFTNKTPTVSVTVATED
jgi:hypothetical protein